MSPTDDHPVEPTRDGTSPGRRLARNLALYTLLRLGMFVVVTAAIVGLGELVGTRVPLLVAGLIAVIIVLPLSMVLFTRLRRAVNEDIAAIDANRRDRREELRRRMSEH